MILSKCTHLTIHHLGSFTFPHQEHDVSASESARPAPAAASASVVASSGPLAEEFIPAAEDSAKPMLSEQAYLKARVSKVDLESGVGTSQMVAITSSGLSSAGYYCKVCDCTLKDSMAYLDHINGKKRT
jgi:hypothetical protein